MFIFNNFITKAKHFVHPTMRHHQWLKNILMFIIRLCLATDKASSQGGQNVLLL